MASVLFEDIFDVKDIDPEGKRFDRVSRLHCESESFKMDLIIDLNTQLYPIGLGEKFRLAITTSLTDDIYSDDTEWTPGLQLSARADNFDYIMHGKIYRIEGDDASSDATRLAAFASFGGLLMRLQGDPNNLHGFELDKLVYLLLKRVAY
ncbi:DNA-directed RNA polymerases I, II, and III subunit RPABC3, partial [Fragariocoptes setiger]